MKPIPINQDQIDRVLELIRPIAPICAELRACGITLRAPLDVIEAIKNSGEVGESVAANLYPLIN